jgi:hypothetical protein
MTHKCEITIIFSHYEGNLNEILSCFFKGEFNLRYNNIYRAIV